MSRLASLVFQICVVIGGIALALIWSTNAKYNAAQCAAIGKQSDCTTSLPHSYEAAMADSGYTWNAYTQSWSK